MAAHTVAVATARQARCESYGETFCLPSLGSDIGSEPPCAYLAVPAVVDLEERLPTSRVATVAAAVAAAAAAAAAVAGAGAAAAVIRPYQTLFSPHVDLIRPC